MLNIWNVEMLLNETIFLSYLINQEKIFLIIPTYADLSADQNWFF